MLITAFAAVQSARIFALARLATAAVHLACFGDYCLAQPMALGRKRQRGTRVSQLAIVFGNDRRRERPAGHGHYGTTLTCL
jgi:hypothetical protein